MSQTKNTSKRGYASRREYKPKNDELLREICEWYETPAAALAFGILQQTITDLRARDAKKHLAARAFLRTPDFARLVSALDLDVAHVRARCEKIAAPAQAV